MIFIIIYVALGYWATGVVLYEDKIVIYQEGQLFGKKLGYGAVFGWALIPIALLKRLGQHIFNK